MVYSVPLHTAPSSPGNLTATVTGSDMVVLRWIEPECVNDDNITGYQVIRNGLVIEANIIPSTDGAFFVYNAISLTPATVYTFQVAAINSVGASTPAADSATTADGSESV